MKKKTKQPKSVKVVVKNCPSLASLKIVPMATWRIGELMSLGMSLNDLSIQADKLSAQVEFCSRRIAEIVAELNQRRRPRK